MPYFLNNDEDQKAMLDSIGVDSIDALFTMVPAELRLGRPLNVPPALGELELTSHMSELAARNDPAGNRVCFLGGGSYDHFIPAVVDMSPRGANSTRPTRPISRKSARAISRPSSNIKR